VGDSRQLDDRGGHTVRARLAIMAKRAVEVRECDRCGKEPANTWIITGPDGGRREIEWCDPHGSPIANAVFRGRGFAPSLWFVTG
jgi:hypothetical protein